MRIVMVLMTAAGLSAQSVPRIGWAAVEHQLRPLLGLPGSTRAGDALLAVDQAQVAPGGQTAVILTEGQWRLVGLGDEAAPRQLLDLAGAPTQTAFARDGSAAAFVFADRVEVWSLAAAPERLWRWETTNVAQIDVSPGGRRVAVSETDGTVRLASASGPGAPLQKFDSAGAVRWLGNDALIVADRAGERLVLLERLDSEPAARLLAARSGIVSLEAAADGRRVFVLAEDEGGLKMATFDAATGLLLNEAGTGLKTAGFTRLGAGDLFLLATPSGDAPGWLFDGATARLTFLPALLPALRATEGE
jgi:hypothetical protein